MSSGIKTREWKVSRAFKSIGSGTTPKSGTSEYYDEGSINWLITGDLNDGEITATSKKITPKAVSDYSTLKTYPANSLVIAMYGATIAKVGLLKIPTTVNQACCVLVPSKRIDPRYAYYYFLSSKRKLIDLGSGGGQPNISQDVVRSFKITLPEKPEQKKMVNYLDTKTQTLDKILTAKNHLLDLLEAQKRAAIFNLTTRGVDSSATFRTVPEEWLGSVPESWQQTYLMGCAYERKKKNYPGNIPTLLSLSYGKLITKDIEDNGGLLPESFDTYQLITAGQIVLRLTDLQNDHKSLRVGYATQDGMITSAYSCVTAKDEVLPKYLYYYLHSADLRKVFYSMGGGVRQSMKFADLKRLVMYIPDKITQQEIVDAIEVKVEQIEKLQDKVKKSINLLEEYRSSLISNVVDGKVEV